MPRYGNPGSRGSSLIASLLGLAIVLPASAWAGTGHAVPELPVEEIVLDNGFRLLLVERRAQATVEAGWVIETGSFHDPPGRAGMSHLVEHLSFKGTRTIGTRSWGEERKLLKREDRLVADIERLESAGARRGRIEELRQELAAVRRAAAAQARLGELSLLYSEAGATGLNAHTFKDFTIHLVTVPAEKLELWFWLEADRLLEPVLREFWKEAGVIREERRQRVGSRPGGRQDEHFESLFWGDSAYAHRPLGHPSEVRSISRPEAERFLERNFTPVRLTAVLVGPIDRKRALDLATRYFGRLRGGQVSESVDAKRVESASPLRGAAPDSWRTSCECPTQLRVLYGAVPFGHPDAHPLQVLSGILNGRSGRLSLSMVLERELASSANSWFQGYRHAGLFGIRAVAKGDRSPETLLDAWDEQVAALAEAPPTADEVGRVRAQLAAGAFRRLRQPSNLRTQLLVYAGLGDWREISSGPAKLLQVTPADVQRVARAYLKDARRAVAFYEDASP